MSILNEQQRRAREHEAEVALHSLTAEAAWNNPQDEKAAAFYAKKHLRTLK